MPNKDNVNKNEIKKFSDLAEEWWNESGKFKPLHDINPIRIKYIKENLINYFNIKNTTSKPLANLKILDIGCGGGLLSVPMARLGADITGIDPSEKNIKIAKQYIKENNIKVDYQCTSTTKLIQTYSDKFDIVLNMEVVEHVDNLEDFLFECSKLVKKNGIIFVSTINKTLKSLIQAKFTAEYILRWLPIGTHDWNKFVKPEELIRIMDNNDFKILDIKGMSYNLIKKEWFLSDKLDVNYLVCFIK
ncbi:bifunctional 2-polyprenyl-6-hydroxyphenol methylase/3-demethylubiquinol 3-O-methyltransferase UbiG [Rickettsiales endosymbiont of Trichoplax sp. H2]|uniref:bifunctional 2-polyprenyl-6-hydroxyphenol methylase/3-demethylubiquinol 3-O-methyltransferase UbiG n=1 Tax=Rickettsiales endosymbiont of Trichoplax sp. H2 TaxID=2021221 RepID=UPI0012B365A6|nr:bifunctional 2-polyprenyl-6-hydroxyphenol methylase/3-demethylubiquinol 3-O-methyltransferase UbiG [Rickettsiales endosymbiont of Trichoplax sp. H2]MSO14280.1 Ubiquinone biosynthesis O-methyltransferase [Rickettsiales endosymbiont of Trichoplax sp. H2]